MLRGILRHGQSRDGGARGDIVHSTFQTHLPSAMSVVACALWTVRACRCRLFAVTVHPCNQLY